MRNLFCYFLCALFSFSVFNSAPTNAQSVLPAEIPVEYDVSPLGAFSYTVPLGIPPGIREMVPNLAVTYNSQSGKGLLGIGWTISGLSMITRTDATIFHNQLLDPVDFDNNDVFALDGQRLVETDNETYMTEVKNFALIQSFG